MPSIPGILISRKTMSGSRLRTMATASRPLPASPTIESSGQASLRRPMTFSRISRSSSATTAVGVGEGCIVAMLGSGRRRDYLVGNLNRRTGAAFRGQGDDQLGAGVVQGLQTLAHIGQAHATLALRTEADAGVLH